jgi:hypothetical protein
MRITLYFLFPFGLTLQNTYTYFKERYELYTYKDMHCSVIQFSKLV